MRRDELVARARRAPALRRLPAGALRELVAAADLRELRRGEVLFEEGAAGEHVYLVLRGSLRVSKDTGEGTSALVALRGELEWIGELALERGERRSATADAEGPALLLELPRADFTRALRDHPEAALDLLRFVSSRLRESDRALIDSLRKRTEELLARSERLGEEVRRLRRSDVPARAFEAFRGGSGEAARVRAAAARAAANERPVLLVGERGTGRELVASLIHRASERRAGPFVVFDCGALPGATLEADLFGCARGGVPGARRARPGALERAAAGTVYLAGIESLHPAAEHALFRFLEVGELQRVGETRVRRADVRVVAGLASPPAPRTRAAATPRVAHDLLARLEAQRIDLPPLRSRPEDVEPLLARIAEEVADTRGVAPLRFDAAALGVLRTHELPGNGDDLVALVEHLHASCPPGSSVGPADLDARERPAPSREHYSEAVRAFKIQLVERALREAGGHRARAAERLGIHRSNLSRMIRELGLDRGSGR